MNFSPKRAAEVDVFTVDFGPLLAQGEAIKQAPWSVSVVDGLDASPSAMVIGAPTITDAQVSQELGGGVPGVTYAPICTALTSLGRTLILPEAGRGLLFIPG